MVVRADAPGVHRTLASQLDTTLTPDEAMTLHALARRLSGLSAPDPTTEEHPT